jgi:hypothetical protein
VLLFVDCSRAQLVVDSAEVGAHPARRGSLPHAAGDPYGFGGYRQGTSGRQWEFLPDRTWAENVPGLRPDMVAGSSGHTEKIDYLFYIDSGCAAGLARGIPAELEPAPTTSTRGVLRWGRLRPLRFGRGAGGQGAAGRAQLAGRRARSGRSSGHQTAGQPFFFSIPASPEKGARDVRSAASKG